MTPHQLLTFSKGMLAGPDEIHWRTAVSRAYYAAFHATRDFFRSLRFRVPGDGSAHKYLSERLQNAGEAIWIQAGGELDDLRSARNEADYDLSASFGVTWAEKILDRIDDYFDLLDQLRRDPNVFNAVQAIRAYEQGRGAVTSFGP
jgi:hypothetical protein